MTSEEYLNLQKSNVHFSWEPKPDITVHELALLLPYAAHIQRLTLEVAENFQPATALRHFNWIYDARDPVTKARVLHLHRRLAGEAK